MLNAPLKAVTLARPILTRINLPREAILLSALAQVVFSILVRLVLLIGVFVWFHLAPATTAWLFPFGVLSLVLVGFVAGILITPVGATVQRCPADLLIATLFLMLLTPVVYPLPQAGVAAAIANLNPLTPLVTATRDWLDGRRNARSSCIYFRDASSKCCFFLDG